MPASAILTLLPGKALWFLGFFFEFFLIHQSSRLSAVKGVKNHADPAQHFVSELWGSRSCSQKLPLPEESQGTDTPSPMQVKIYFLSALMEEKSSLAVEMSCQCPSTLPT